MRVSRPVGAGVLALAVAVVAALVIGWAVSRPSGGGDRGGEVGSPFDRFPGPGERHGPGRSVPGAPNPKARLVSFVGFVFQDVQRSWQAEFARAHLTYRPARLVLFRRAIRSGCGPASTATGPFYCPLDRSVYLDLGFFRALATAFDAPGDFAQAYVIAHEVSHHVQTLTGVTQEVTAAESQDPSIANQLSIPLELQADCLAGVWAHSTYERGLLESGDLEEGLAAAAAVGDDRIQAKTTGRIDPETWTHGTSEQRAGWFLRGFEAGEAAACDTFGSEL
jgi:predicted metalloprotease